MENNWDESCCEKIKDLRELLTETLDTVVTDRGVWKVNTHEAGEVVDMVKDLAQAEYHLAKACYYKKMVEKMEDEEHMVPKPAM